MIDINTRNAVLDLFNEIEVDKFPDERFELIKNEPSHDQIYWRETPIDRLFFNLFDFVEKHIRPDTNYITLVVFKCTVIQLVKISDLELLINKLVALLRKDNSMLGQFTEEDAKQFEKGRWAGRTWSIIEKKEVLLDIRRTGDCFELRMNFYQ